MSESDNDIPARDRRHRIFTWVRAIAFVVALALLAIAAKANGWDQYLFGDGAIARLQALTRENLAFAIAAYTAAVVVGGTVFAVPGIAFALAAGVLFGPWLGIACCTVASTVTAVVSLLAGRTFLKDVVKPLAMRNRHLRRWLFEETDRDAPTVLFVTRLVPLFPFNLQNFAYGATDIDLWTYTWCTTLFMLPGTTLFTLVAAGFADSTQSFAAMAATLAASAIIAVGALLLARRPERAAGEGPKDTR